MITKVNPKSWDLVEYNWPVDTRNSSSKNTQDTQRTKSLYIFDHRDEPYRHVYGGRWNLFPKINTSSYIDEWA